MWKGLISLLDENAISSLRIIIILITEIHVVVYWNGILKPKKYKYTYHIIFKHSFFS